MEPVQSRIAPEELDVIIVALVNEVRTILATDRWVFTRAGSVEPTMLAAAGLSHCCSLASEMVAAHNRGQEMTGRIVARALFETWAIAYYLQLGGVDAHEAVTADYVYAREAQSRSVAEAEDAARRRRRRIVRGNKRIAEENANKERWNVAHPTLPPKELTALADVPPVVAPGLSAQDWSANLPGLEPRRLPLIEVLQRLSPLTRERGYEETYALAYDYAYRSLSYLGAHATLWVLSTYVDDRYGTGFFRRIRERAIVPSSFDEPNKYMAALLVAALAVAVFGAREQEAPIAQRIFDRFHGRNSDIVASSGSAAGSTPTLDSDLDLRAGTAPLR